MQSTLGINVSLMGRFFCIEDAKVMGLTPNPDLCLKAITPSGDTKQSISAAASLPPDLSGTRERLPYRRGDAGGGPASR